MTLGFSSIRECRMYFLEEIEEGFLCFGFEGGYRLRYPKKCFCQGIAQLSNWWVLQV